MRAFEFERLSHIQYLYFTDMCIDCTLKCELICIARVTSNHLLFQVTSDHFKVLLNLYIFI